MAFGSKRQTTNTTKPARTEGFLSRTPFAVAGAFGLISLASGALSFEQNVKDWIIAWQHITNSLWAWAPEISVDKKNYLTMGIINSGMVLRAYLRELNILEDWRFILVFLGSRLWLFVLIWPLYMAKFLLSDIYLSLLESRKSQAHILSLIPDNDVKERFKIKYQDEQREIKEMLFVYSETFVYASLIIALNYGMMG